MSCSIAHNLSRLERIKELAQDELTAHRAGRYVRQPTGYRAFIPNPLPPEPSLRWDDELLALLSAADQSLGRLDGMGNQLPNPDMFVTMYIRKEAVLSSQIEGTQASLEDVLEYEANARRSRLPADVEETYNYVKALNAGLTRLDELPVCNRLFREIHGILMQGVRGQEKSPGEFRTSQNWIGAPGSSLNTATYVPPPPYEMAQAMGDLELYLNDGSPIPLLIKCGLAHGQFEMIHPFLDGNGRLGRLLIAFLLCHHQALTRPLLYLSAYFKQNQDEYYDRLYAISNAGDWEGWLKFFLKGVGQVSQEAAETARQIIAMREEHQQLVIQNVGGRNGLPLLDSLYQNPVVIVASMERMLNVSYVTASNLARTFQALGILKEITQRPRNKIYVYQPYLDILNKDL